MILFYRITYYRYGSIRTLHQPDNIAIRSMMFTSSAV